MGSFQGNQELGLDYRPSSAKHTMNRTINEFLGHVSMIEDVSERLMKLQEYTQRLEDEMRKILVFKNELPFSMLILKDAIGVVKEEVLKCRRLKMEPVLEQFIPLKKICEEEDEKKVEILEGGEKSEEKMNWLSSVQLWNGSSELDIRETIGDEMKSCESRSMGTVFGPLKGYNGFSMEVIRKEEEDIPLVPELSLRIPGIKNPRADIFASGLNFKGRASSRTGSASTSNDQSSVLSGSQSQQQSDRKQRRCWSPELHRRFIEALEKLGGSRVATPKQIRELMQVDGLTNDEVKSHLQKYRLHIRRAPNTKASVQDHSQALGGLLSSVKQSDSQSGSPQGPLHSGGNSQVTSMTADDCMEEEDDEKSESECWKSHHVHSSENTSV